MNKAKIGFMDGKCIKAYGKVLYGKDIRNLIEEPTQEMIQAEGLRLLRERIRLFEKHQNDFDFVLDTVYMALRIYALHKEGLYLSKSGAKDFYLEKEPNSMIRSFIIYRYSLTKQEQAELGNEPERRFRVG